MDISWTWLGIVVLALIIFACASGCRRGFVKEIVSAFCQACITGEKGKDIVEEAYSATLLCLLGNQAML